MEEEGKISFWKKIKISIFGLEEYQKLAIQRIGTTVAYIAIIMLIFTFFISITLTYQFNQVVNNISKYIDENIDILNFKDGILEIQEKDNLNSPIVLEDENDWGLKIIIDTAELTDEQIDEYKNEISGYNSGVLILKDEIILITTETGMTVSILFSEIADQFHIVQLDKQDILDFTSGNNIYYMDFTFFCAMLITIFINYFSAILLDIILYSVIAHIVGIILKLRLKYRASYCIAAYSLTLPIVLNLIYIIVNLLTGYTIKYFSIMYMAITCIYIFTAILMIKSDMIKKQMELSKIISEQEKVKQEIERQEQERREEEERERVRKEDEKKRQEEKKKKEKSEKKIPKEKPEPQANIKETN